MSSNPKSGIYAIKNTINGKIYVGSAVNIAGRWRGHLSQLRKGKHHSAHLQAAWNKHGEQAFVFDVLQEVPERQNLILEENKWIQLAGSADRSRGYNMCVTAGSQLGMRHSQEVRNRMSERRKGEKKSAPHQEAINLALRGRRLSDEHRAKISASRTGQKASEETRQKMRKTRSNLKEMLSEESYRRMVTANVGRKFTESHCQKIAEANRRRVVSDETRKKLSDARRRTEAMKKMSDPLMGYELKSKLANG